MSLVVFSVFLLNSIPSRAEPLPRDKIIGAWEFNDPSGATEAAADAGFGTIRFPGTAAFSAAGEGQTGREDDYALTFGDGTGGNGLAIMDDDDFFAAMNAAADDDVATVVFWQRWLKEVENSSTFWFNTGHAADLELGSGPGPRIMQAHVPWGNGRICFENGDTSNPPTIDRLIGTPEEGFTWKAWHHFAFVKNGSTRGIWIDGTLLVSGPTERPLWLGGRGAVCGWAAATLAQGSSGLFDRTH